MRSLATRSKREAQKDATHQKLLEAALQLFVERGFEATTTVDLAARAGVSKGTLYLYYKSKDDLLEAVISEYLASAIATARLRVGQHQGSLAALLLELLCECWEQVYESSGSAVIKIIMTEARNFPELANFYQREVIDPGEHIVAEIIKRGVESGEFKPVNVDDAVRSLMFPMILLCVHKHSLVAAGSSPERVDFRPFVRSHVGLMLNGMLIAKGSAIS